MKPEEAARWVFFACEDTSNPFDKGTPEHKVFSKRIDELLLENDGDRH